MVKDTACIRVNPQDIASGRQLYDHQREALKNMDIINKEQSFSTLIVFVLYDDTITYPYFFSVSSFIILSSYLEYFQ